MDYEPIDEKDLDQPATKRDVQNVRQDLAKEITTRSNKTDGLIKNLSTDLKTWKDEILTSNDKVSKEYKTFESEKAALSGRVDRLDAAVFPNRN